MSFSMTEGGPSPAVNATRLKRQLVEQAIAAATAAEWEAAADLNRRILDLGADSAAENRLAKSYWEMGELATYVGLLKNVHGLVILTKQPYDLSCGAYEALSVAKPAVISDWPGSR